MKTRVITSVVGLALLGVVLFFYSSIFVNILFAGVSLIAIHEVYNAFQFGKRSWYIFAGFVPITVLIMLSDYISVQHWLKPAGYVFVLYLVLCLIIRFDAVNFAKLSGMTIFSAIIVFCFYSFINLKTILPNETYGYDAIYFVLLIFAFAWGGDTAAYFAGRAFGKHKLAPIISPHKTIEGAIGGVIGSIVVGLLVSIVYIQVFGRFLPFERVRIVYYFLIVLLGAVASVLGIIGDLFASAVKRQCNIKDYGTIFPGHGGILDRFDSVLFIAPLVTMVVTSVFYRLKL